MTALTSLQPKQAVEEDEENEDASGSSSSSPSTPSPRSPSAVVDLTGPDLTPPSTPMDVAVESDVVEGGGRRLGRGVRRGVALFGPRSPSP